MSYYKKQELIPEERERKIRQAYDELGKLKEQNKIMREALDNLIDKTEYGVNQWQKAWMPNEETEAQKAIEKAKQALEKINKHKE
jgi:YD repeat-containing protein